MFFFLSKVLWAVLSPLNLVFLIMLLGTYLRMFSKALGRSVVFLGLFLFILFGLFPIGHNLLAYLEARYHKPVAMPSHVDGILVLGGTFLTDLTEARSEAQMNDTAERVIEALSLSRVYPSAKVIYSGGSGKLTGSAMSEAEAMKLFLRQFGFPEDRFVYEDKSRNTYENFLYSKEMAQPQPGQTWLLVTSAWHMPRSMAVAEAAAWPGITPWPVDYSTEGSEIIWLPHGFDMIHAFTDTQLALHEFIGMIAYQLTGKISLSAP